MEFFLPSILFLLVACGIVFFVIPRFGPLVLAIVSLVLLGLGIYNHYSMFESEYRMSTWQMGAVAYAPIVMVVALVLGIILYLFYLTPVSGNGNEVPSLPAAGTATNALTEGVNNLLRSGQELLGATTNNNTGYRNTSGNNRGSNNSTTNNRPVNNSNKPSFLENINPFNRNNNNRRQTN
jgi:hypothetical protein